GNLTANSITSNSATLNWMASTDNVGVTAYNVFIDGNQVGPTTNTSFDVTGLTELTTYSAAVTAEDLAGNTSASATTSFTTLEGGGTGGPGVIAAYYFESGLQGWTEGGNDAQRQASSNSFEGAYSIKLRDGSSTSNAFSPAIDLSGNTQVTVEFHTYTTKMDNGEGYVVEFSSGGAYQVIGSYSVGTDFSNDTFFTDTITLSSASYTFNANNRFRIRCLGSSNKDQMWFDQVIVSGDNTENTASTNNQQVLLDYTQAVNDGVRMYPNPAEDVLNVEIIEGNFDSVQVFSTMGQVIFEASAVTNSLRVDTSQFASGTYFVRFISNGLAVTKRFVKK
ncbi:MAG: T9SS type A sorting domain-containing protein, partial [Marinirhabdus sp.]|nr:T9SS type A sorting domain-containing protein [Marinirhabdus sp.]